MRTSIIIGISTALVGAAIIGGEYLQLQTPVPVSVQTAAPAVSQSPNPVVTPTPVAQNPVSHNVVQPGLPPSAFGVDPNAGGDPRPYVAPTSNYTSSSPYVVTPPVVRWQPTPTPCHSYTIDCL